MTMEFGWVYLCLSVTLGGCSGQLFAASEGPDGYSPSVRLLATTAPASMMPENKTLALTTPTGTPASQGHNTESSSVDDNRTSVSQKTTPSGIASPTAPSSTPAVSTASATVPAVESSATSRAAEKRATEDDDRSPFDYQTLDESFTYDYHALRVVGLGMACLFFLTGILVIASSRLTKIPKCRKRSGKTYEVTRV